MKFPASQALYSYWSSLCHGRRTPERNDLDPAAMRHVLPQTFMLDVRPEGAEAREMPIRLSGTRLDALFNRDLKGAAFIDLWARTDQDLFRTIAADVLDESTPALVGGTAGPDGAAELGFEVLLLPLRHLGKTHARMLGSLALAGTPTWIGLQPSGPLAITSWRMLNQVVPGRGEAADVSMDRSVRRANLTVYTGGRAAGAATAPASQAHVKPGLSRWVSRR